MDDAYFLSWLCAKRFGVRLSSTAFIGGIGYPWVSTVFLVIFVVFGTFSTKEMGFSAIFAAASAIDGLAAMIDELAATIDGPDQRLLRPHQRLLGVHQRLIRLHQRLLRLLQRLVRAEQRLPSLGSG
jgi:hypothetical protein